jgi:PAS domain S-box-containing protein
MAMKPKGLSRRAVRRLCDGVSLILAVIALRTLLGWGLGSAGWIRILPGYPPMFPAAGLGLLALAGGLAGLGRRMRRVGATGAVVALAVGTAILAAGQRGRSTAVCLIVTAAALLLALGPRFSWRWAASGLLATAVGSFALITGLCYASGVLDELRFDLTAGMSIEAAVAFLLAALPLLALAYTAENPVGALPDWAPWGAGVASLMVTLSVWGVLLVQNRLNVVAATRSQAVVARHDVEQATGALVTTLRILPWSEQAAGGEWPATVRRLLAEVGGLARAVQTDRSLNVYAAGGPDSLDLSSALRSALRSRETPGAQLARDSVLVGMVPVPRGPRLLAVAVPRCGESECTGYVVALLDAQRFLRETLRDAVPGYFVAVGSRGEVLYQSAGATRAGVQFEQLVPLDIGALHLDVGAWPSEERLLLHQPQLPNVVAALGLLLSAFLALTFWLMRRSLARTRLEERARLALALETATDGVWEWDLPTGSGSVSPALWRRLGYDDAGAGPELDLARWRSLIHPDDQRRVQQAIDRHLQGEAPSFDVEYRVRARDGSSHLIVERGRVAERGADGRPRVVLGVAADVTERRRADEALAASEQRLRAMFDSAFQFQTLLDVDGHCLEANRAALEFAGVTMESVRGRKLWDTPWWAGSEEEQARLRRACAEATAGRTVRYEAEWSVNGGRAIVDFSIKPILDRDARVIQLLAEGRDVTESRRAESAMRELETLSTMGRLAARVAHEVNNPLAGIQNSFLLIRDAVPETHPYYAYVGAIEREIGRISAVTRQLYETYRPDPDAAPEVSLPTVLSDAVSLLRQVNRAAKVTIEVDSDGVHGTVPIPAALARQAIYNLVQNAIDASPPGGVVRVTATATDRVFSLSVRDQGPGIPDDLREQIFAPFFTTKTGGRTSGMGLGLALVRRSVDALGGRIRIRDVPEGGTEFLIEIPLTRPSGPQPGQAEP